MVKNMYKETKFSKKDIENFTKDIELLSYEGDIEEFRQVIYNGYYTQYLISSYGRVVSTRYRGVDGRVRILKLKTSTTKYFTLTLVIKNNKHVMVLVHRMVGEAFIPNPDNKPQINHKDANKKHNHVSNLEWATAKENIDHVYENNLKRILKGEEIKDSKYKEEDIIRVCKYLEENKLSIKEISLKTGVHSAMIIRIKNHKSWKHISSNFNIDNYHDGLSKEEYDKKIENINKVCKMLESNMFTIKQISDMTNIGYGMVIKIWKKECYRDISSNYDLSKYMSKSVKSKYK